MKKPKLLKPKKNKVGATKVPKKKKKSYPPSTVDMPSTRQPSNLNSY